VLETPHVLVAAAIAVKITNPYLSLPLALGSHFILERVPHWNPHLNTEKKKFGKLTKSTFNIILIDSSLALILGTSIALKSSQNSLSFLIVMLACFLAAAPDLIEAPYYILNSKSQFIESKWIPFKKSIQVDAKPFWGLLWQILISITAIYWALS